MSLCLSGFQDMLMNIVWSPDFHSTADGPTWIHKLSLYVELELRFMNELYGNILSEKWSYYTFIYVEAYVRTLLAIELNGAFVEPWYEDFERSVLNTFNKYNVTTKQLIEKYGMELFRVSNCASAWPKDVKYTVWPFIDMQKPNARCVYVSVDITIDQTITNMKEDDIFLHNCSYDKALLADAMLDLLMLNEQPETTINPFKVDTAQEGKVTRAAWCGVYEQTSNVVAHNVCDKCTGDTFKCGDGQCIPMLGRCNNIQECLGTNADEIDCPKPVMNTSLKCCGTNGQSSCQQSQICDGIVDCFLTFEDEINCTKCAGFACGDGQCIPERFRCDGKRVSSNLEMTKSYPVKLLLNDFCLNGADEMGCNMSANVCPLFGFRCPNGTCLTAEQRCNDKDDCVDGSDEDNCRLVGYLDYCEKQMKCDDTKSSCYWPNGRCDSVAGDCPNGNDEKDCNVCMSQSCNTRRPDGSIDCYHTSSICDGKNDCRDGTDEQNCCSTFSCDNGTMCLPFAAKCNTTTECKDKSDEMACLLLSSQFDCGEQYFIDNTAKCNGITDCPNMNDELNCPTNITINNDICVMIESLLPECDNYKPGWTPMAHGRNCRMHKLPWRMRSSFAALKLSNQTNLLCDGIPNCANGIDELAFICGNYNISISEVKPSHMKLTSITTICE